jgi:hypothetical protein
VSPTHYLGSSSHAHRDSKSSLTPHGTCRIKFLPARPYFS